MLDRRRGVAGELVLRRQGGDYELVVDGTFLMDTRDGRSERVLARCALEAATRPRRVLVGGLGMGMTLAEVLADGRVERVTVAELEPVLVAWHRRFLAGFTGAALADPRATVAVRDVVELIDTAAPASWDAICLDVDNGPDWLARPQNAGLYTAAGVRALARALDPGGAVAVWSSAPAPALRDRLRAGFADIRVLEPPSRGPRPDWVVVAGTPDPAAASERV